jgi:hypothetical protein
MDCGPLKYYLWTLFVCCKKYRRWSRCFVRSGEFEKTKGKIKLFNNLDERWVFTLVRQVWQPRRVPWFSIEDEYVSARPG